MLFPGSLKHRHHAREYREPFQCVSKSAGGLGSQICCGLFAAFSEVTNRCMVWVVLSDYMGLKDRALRISMFFIGNIKCSGMMYRKPLHPLESPLGSRDKMHKAVSLYL